MREALAEDKRRQFETEASRSLEAQREIEASDNVSFSEYLDNYFKQSAADNKKLSA